MPDQKEKTFTIRKLFFTWLTICVVFTFIIKFFVSFNMQTRQANKNAERMIVTKIQDAKKQLQVNDKNYRLVEQMVADDAIAKLRSFALMIKYSPELLESASQMEEIAKKLGVDELHVSDEKGILIATYPASYTGYNMKSSPQSAAFMQAINDPLFVLVQPVQYNGSKRKLFQYTGMGRLDKPGILQIGYQPSRLEETKQITGINNIAAGLRIGHDGKIVICDLKGKILSSIDTGRINNPIETYGISLLDIKGNQGQFFTKMEGIKYLCCYEKYGPYFILGLLPNHELYFDRNEMLLELSLLYIILFCIVFALVSLLVQKIVIVGIHQVNRSLKKITEGDLEEKVQVTTSQEFKQLSEGINKTVMALKVSIAATAARIDKELEAARSIQISALPNVFPPFPWRKEFNIYARMETAKEVGGDFYDFFLMDSTHLVVVIADVSGKGIPAALFMMTAKTLINNQVKPGIVLKTAITQVNAHLCENNKEGMFVTAFIGILDTKTGIFTCVSAGHNPPLFRKKNKKYEWLQSEGGFMLASFEEASYEQSEIQLEPGERLFFYTDGVTEAMNEDGNQFGEKQLEDTLNINAEKKMIQSVLVDNVYQALKNWRGKAPQSDDITTLVLDFNYCTEEE